MIKLDGVPLLLQPSEVSWGDRSAFFTANGFPVYPKIRTLKLTFTLMTPDEWGQLVTFFSNHRSNPGTVEAYLFETGAPYVFYAIPEEPTFDNFFDGYYRNVSFTLHVLI